MPKISVHPLAQRELQETTDYYTDIDISLAGRFLDDFDSAVSFITLNPQASPILIGNVRRKLFDRFPYAVFYRLREDTIRVLAVAHQKRRPFYWSDRV